MSLARIIACCLATIFAFGALSSRPTHAGVVVVNFDAIDTSAGLVSGATLITYLATFGITATVGSNVDLVVLSNLGTYGGGVVNATTGVNFLGMTGGRPATYSLYFSTPLQSLEFDRIGEPAGSPGTIFPPWNAAVFDINGFQIGSSVGEALRSSYGFVAPIHYTFPGPGITRLDVNGDHLGFAAFTSANIDTLVLTTVPEPGSLTILGASLVAVAFARFKAPHGLTHGSGQPT